MSDWKERFGRFSIERNKREAEKEREKERRKKEAEEREYQRKLHELQGKCKCYICGHLPTGPRKVMHREGSGPEATTWWETNWNLPKDLEQCVLCQKWVCEICYSRNSCCQGCATQRRWPDCVNCPFSDVTCQKCAEEMMRKAEFSG